MDEKSNKSKQNVIISIFALLILLASFLLKRIITSTTTPSWQIQFVYDTVFSIAFVMIGICLTNLVWSLVGGEPIDVKLNKLLGSMNLSQASIRTGLTNIMASNGSFGNDNAWIDIISKANKHVDLQGYTLLSMIKMNKFSDVIVSRLAAGVNIRILVMAEDARFLNVGINDTQIPALNIETVRGEIKSTTRFIEDIKEKNAGKSYLKNLEFRKVKFGLISSRICKSDSTIIITPYLNSVDTGSCPLLSVENSDSDLYQKYEKEFDYMWKYDIDYKHKHPDA